MNFPRIGGERKCSVIVSPSVLPERTWNIIGNTFSGFTVLQQKCSLERNFQSCIPETLRNAGIWISLKFVTKYCTFTSHFTNQNLGGVYMLPECDSFQYDTYISFHVYIEVLTLE